MSNIKRDMDKKCAHLLGVKCVSTDVVSKYCLVYRYMGTFTHAWKTEEECDFVETNIDQCFDVMDSMMHEVKAWMDVKQTMYSRLEAHDELWVKLLEYKQESMQYTIQMKCVGIREKILDSVRERLGHEKEQGQVIPLSTAQWVQKRVTEFYHYSEREYPWDFLECLIAEAEDRIKLVLQEIAQKEISKQNE